MSWISCTHLFPDNFEESRSEERPVSTLFMARSNEDGFEALPIVNQVSSLEGYANHPTMDYNGSIFGLAWEDSRQGNKEIYFAYTDRMGRRLGNELRITHNEEPSGNPVVKWTGDAFKLFWTEENDFLLHMTTLSAAGLGIQGEGIVASFPNNGFDLSVAWTGSEFGVLMVGPDEINPVNHANPLLFARLNPDGRLIGDIVQATDLLTSTPWEPALSWTGSEYGLVWYDYHYSDLEVSFARISSTGNKLGRDVRITDTPAQCSTVPALSWTGSEYGLVWSDNTSDYGHDIFFARLDGEGRALGPHLELNYDSQDSYSPNIVWTGSEYGIIWQSDDGDGKWISFARVVYSR